VLFGIHDIKNLVFIICEILFYV